MKRLLIDYHGPYVRVALMNDSELVEIFVDIKGGGSIVGNIINGLVKNIMPSKFAFIDIGEEKNAFMNLPAGSKLKCGDSILVQVRKDASGTKGANVSDDLKFKGKYSILHPGSGEIGVSKKIFDKSKRKHLRRLAANFLPAGYSCIMRTGSADVSDEALSSEFDQLTNRCSRILESAKYSLAPKILHRNNFILNELLTDDIHEIIIKTVSENPTSYVGIEGKSEELGRNENGIIGDVITDNRVKIWDKDIELFDAYGINRQIKKALQRDVWLPCGGSVTFDQVEACVVIDVNTGKFLGKRNYRESIQKVNLEAAECIAKQIALRNLSGMIIVDFIDMTTKEDKNELLDFFGRALSSGRIPADIVGMTDLGLVQLTRRKQREPLNKILQRPCPHCGGLGRVSL